MKSRCQYDQVEDYFESLRIRSIKEITIERYRSQLVSLGKAFEETGRVFDARTMTADDVHIAMSVMDIAESSREKYAGLIRGLARFHGNHGLDDLRIMTNGNRPNVRWIDDDQFLSLLRTEDITTRLIVHLGGNYGLRRGEISALTVDEIRPGYMVVHGKGHGEEGRIRRVPLIADKDPVIEEYLLHRSSLLEGPVEDRSDGRLLVYRQHFRVAPIRPEGIGRRLKACMDRLGIDGSTHSLRREFITSSLRSGCNLYDVMKVVGHTDPRITMRYMRTDMDKLRDVVTARNQYIPTNVCQTEEDEIGAF